jgi:hypothetical protein
VERGIGEFIALMRAVTSAANRGDLGSADRHVKEAGRRLVDLGTELRAYAEMASAPELRGILTDMADELTRQGGALRSLPALQRFDTARLRTIAERITALCERTSGRTPRPAPSGPSVPPAPSGPSVPPESSGPSVPPESRGPSVPSGPGVPPESRRPRPEPSSPTAQPAPSGPLVPVPSPAATA